MRRKMELEFIGRVLFSVVAVVGPCSPAVARPWSPNSPTERFFAVAAKQVSTIRMVARFSYLGGPPATVRILAELTNPRKFDGEIMFPPRVTPRKNTGRDRSMARKFIAPQIYHVVVNGEKVWWGQPAEGPNVVPGAWYFSYFPKGHQFLPYTSWSSYGVTLLRKALIPITILRNDGHKKMARGVSFRVTTRRAEVPGQVYRIYSAWYHRRQFSRIVMRINTSDGLRIYSTAVWVMVDGRLTLASKVWAGRFRRINGVWIPMKICERRLGDGRRSDLGPTTSLIISRTTVNPIFHQGQFHLVAPEGSLVYRGGSHNMNFVSYRSGVTHQFKLAAQSRH
ncbi:MAG: hypothetical protein ACP5O1_11480 [Phycisphaerae bacterium]